MISPSYCGVHQRRRWRSVRIAPGKTLFTRRSEEHTSELQSQSNLECRLLLEKKNVIGDQHDDDERKHVAQVEKQLAPERMVEQRVDGLEHRESHQNLRSSTPCFPREKSYNPY